MLKKFPTMVNVIPGAYKLVMPITTAIYNYATVCI